ncbi:unnamed protein product [Caenorhabditis nigoni]
MITMTTIRSAFSLANTDVLSLAYKVSGRVKHCRVNEAGTAFHLPMEWESIQFHVHSSSPVSRPSSTDSFEESLAEQLIKRLYFIPRLQRSFQDSSKPGREPMKKNYIDGGCVTPISSRAAVTFSHRSHKVLKEYDEKQSAEFNGNSIVEIRSATDFNVAFKMKVIVVDTHHDFVILRSIDGTEIFEDYPWMKRSPKPFEWFIGLGLSYETEDGQKITHRHGRICSSTVDHRGRLLASASIEGGDSGGPCYSADKSFLGIMVASTSSDPCLESQYNQELLEEEISVASSCPADTLITPANCIAEAYKKYLVDNGLLHARKEALDEEPKPKRRALGSP